uniref:F-box domain-containing protein n=1 Tax=Aegilops tauschii TaxID=37682 RepID=N1R4R3_AEGTA
MAAASQRRAISASVDRGCSPAGVLDHAGAPPIPTPHISPPERKIPPTGTMPPPELCHDLLVDILTRLPPDDPGCLFPASLVCTAWRALLTSPEFARHYREVHRTPPLLGFFENHDTVTPWFAPSSRIGGGRKARLLGQGNTPATNVLFTEDEGLGGHCHA